MNINGLNALTTYGLQLRAGADEQLLQFPQVKPGYEYSWPDENGMETDPSETPVFERITYSLPILIEGAGKTDFFAKYNAFRSFVLTAGEFNLDIPHLARRFKVRFSKMSSFSKLNMFTESGRIYCLFTLELTDDYPADYFTIPA